MTLMGTVSEQQHTAVVETLLAAITRRDVLLQQLQQQVERMANRLDELENQHTTPESESL